MAGDTIEIVVAIALIVVIGATALFFRHIHRNRHTVTNNISLPQEELQRQPALFQQLQEATSSHQSWIRSGIWFPFFVLSVAANVAQLWDFFPSAPEISPAPPTVGYQFQVPFFMESTNVAFDINHLVVTCVLDQLVGNSSDFATDSRVTSNVPNMLRAKHHGFYTCPFNVFLKPGESIERARIHFRFDYDQPWPLPGKTWSDSEHFEWDPYAVPPQWIQGERIL